MLSAVDIDAKEEWRQLRKALKRCSLELDVHVVVGVDSLHDEINDVGDPRITCELLSSKLDLKRQIREFEPHLLHLFCHGVGARSCLRLLPAVYLILLSLGLTTALALVFSTFSTPALSALFTFFLWVIGHFNGDLLELGRLVESAVFLRLCRVLYYVLPNFSNFSVIDSRNVIQSAAYYRPIDPWGVAWATAYGLVYGSLLLGIAIAVFSRRDFK